MRVLKSITLIVILAIIGFGCGNNKKKELIKIGCILPLTGDMAKFGISFKNGIDLAVSEINRDQNKIQVIYEDDKANAKESVSCMEKLNSIEGVKYFIGGVMSSTMMPIVPIVIRNKRILISPTATASVLNNYHDYIFRMQPSDDYDGKFTASYVWYNMKIKKCAIFYVNNDWGNSLDSAFSKFYNGLGGNIAIRESFKLDETDFRSQLLKIKNSKPDILYLLGYLHELSGILKQMKELNLKIPIVSAFSMYDHSLLSIAPDIIDGAIISVPIFNANVKNKKVVEFSQNYNLKYGSVPDMFAAHAYDCMVLLWQAISTGKNDAQNVNKILKVTRDFEGVTGKTTFSNGEVIKNNIFMTVKNGKFEIIN